MKTLHTIYSNFAKRNLARFLTVFTILFTIGIGQILGATASYTWDLTSSSANWTSSNCEAYFSQPYGMKKEDAYIINKNIDEFKQYAATATSIQIGVKSLCNGATTSKLTIYLVDKDGNTVGSGMTITPDNKSNASNTTYKYVTFTSNLSTATGYKIQCTTFGRNVLVNGSSYEITYDDSSSGSGNTGGGNDSDGCTWELVTDASTLAAGDRIVIAAAGYDYAMGDNSSNGEYRIRTAITKNENKIAITNDVQIIILEEGTKTNTFAFNVDDSYLYASSSSSNQLKTKSTLDNNGSWSITIANGGVATIKAQGDKTRNWIRYNANSTQERFSCYGSGQSDVVIYKEICAKEVTITLNPDGGTGTFADWITSGDNYTMIVDAGTEITLPTLQKAGYNFAGWHDGTATVTSPYTTTKDITLTAQWTANKHSLTWNLNGGIVTTAGTNAAVNSTGTASGSVAYGTAIKAPVVIKTGYTFAGWHDGNSIVTPPNTMPDNNISYKAQWTPNTYTVHFDANEGTGEMENQSFTYDAEPTSLSANIFERVGYNFNGWNTAEDGSGTSYADKAEVKNLTFEANGVVTLYAQWTAKDLINYRTLCTYDIVLKNNYVDDDSKDGLATITSTHTAFSTLTAPSARGGYSIEGYYAESECTTKVVNSDKTLIPNVTNYTDADGKWIGGETTLYTKWTGRTYTVTLDDNGGSGGSGTITATYGSPMPAITLPTRTGYTFNGYWTGTTIHSTQYYDANGNSLKNWDKAGNTTTLYALWTANTNTPYVVKHYKEQLDGTYPMEADDTDNLTGTTATSVTPAVKSYEGFMAPSTQTVSIAADGSTVVTYQYTRNSYNLSWNVNEGDALTGEYTFGIVKYEAAITQPNTPTRTGYTFTGWSPAEIPANMPANNLEFIAQWAAIHTVTWMVNGNQAEGDPTTSVVNGQTITTLPTTPDVDCNGKVFVGWTTAEIVGETATMPYPLYTELGAFPVVTSNMTFYAVFANGSGDERWVETEIGDIKPEDEVLVTMKLYNGDTYTLDHSNGTSKRPPAQIIAINGNEATFLSLYHSNSIWNISGNATDGYILYPNGSTTTWLYCTASDYNVKVGKNAENLFTIDDGYLRNKTHKVYVGVYNSSDWRHYPANTGTAIANQTLKFYKKTTVYTSYTNYSTSCMAGVCDITNANPIYVTSAVGQKIKATEKLVLTTTDMTIGTVISLSAPNITFYKEGVEITQLTTESAEETFELEIAYQPTISKTTEQPTITLDILGHQFTFNNKISCRSLPETFAIVAKVGNVWYALPSQGLNSTTPPAAYPVEVDNMADPKTVTSVPANADWSLRQVYEASRVDATKDRFVANGENFVFVNNEGTPKALNASASGNYLLTDAQYSGYYETNPGLYEWTPTTTDLETYTLTNAQRTDRTLNVATNTVFGVHSDNKATTEVRFLPITGRYTPVALQVVEWKENSVVIMYNGDPAQTASVSVNGGAVQTTELSGDGVQKDIAVYELAANGLATNPTQSLSITIGSEKVILPIPYIVGGDLDDATLLGGDELTIARRQEIAKISDLVILNGGSVTAERISTNYYKFRNVTIYGGGSLVIPSEKGFGASTITMRVGGVENGQYENLYPQLQLKGTLTNTSGQINLDYLTTNDFYYPLSVPYSVTIAHIQYPVDIYGANVASDNTGSFQFKYYDGAERAAGKTGWIVLDEETNTTLEPNKGYAIWGIPKKVKVNGGESTRQKFGIHRLPLIKAANDMMKSEKDPHETTVYDYNGSKRDSDNGWNYLGNPYLSHYGDFTTADNVMKLGKLVWDEAQGAWLPKYTEQRYVVFTNDCQNYTAELASNTAIPAFSAFFIQADQGGAINFTSPNVATPQSLAARRSEEETKEITTGIILSGEKHSDRTGLLIADQFTQAYEFNADLSKFDNQDMNLYTISSSGKLAFMAINEELAKQTIPLGYSVSTDGMYTIAFDEQRYSRNDIYALYLIDYDRNETTNLLHMDYNFYSETGAHAERFALQVAFAPNTSTDVEYTQVGDVLLSREGNTLRLDNLPSDAAVTVYDAVGHLIEQHTASQLLQLTLQKGYYLLHIGNNQNSVVIDTFIP